MADVNEMNVFAKKKITFGASRLYNRAFPIIILVPLLFVLVVLFLVPVEKAIDATRDMLSPSKLATVRGAVGSLNMFKYLNPTRPGNISGK